MASSYHRCLIADKNTSNITILIWKVTTAGEDNV